MANYQNDTALNAELFQNLLVQSQYALYEASIARAVTTVFDYPVGAGKQVSIPMWDGMVSTKPNEGAAPNPVEANTNSKTITLAEHVWYAQITDFLRDSAAENVMSAMATQAGSALAEGLDKELIALFTNNAITQTIGTAGTDNTVEDLMKAAARIRANKYQGQLFAVLNPLQAYGVKRQLTGTAALANTGLQNTVLNNYFVGTIAGITILEHALVGIDANDDSTGCVFAPGAFGLAQRGGVTMETQRVAAKRAEDVVMTVVAGAGIIRPELAVKILGDSQLAAP
jgi:hypothetical protein